jgi:hypothetical protein
MVLNCSGAQVVCTCRPVPSAPTIDSLHPYYARLYASRRDFAVTGGKDPLARRAQAHQPVLEAQRAQLGKCPDICRAGVGAALEEECSIGTGQHSRERRKGGLGRRTQGIGARLERDPREVRPPGRELFPKPGLFLWLRGQAPVPRG